jgi:uncharacterized membrane protein
MRYGEHIDYVDHMDGGGWVFPAIFILVLIVLAVVGIVWLARSRTANVAPGHASRSEGSARDVLDRRLVSGEIGEEEYRRLRAVLSDAPPPSQPPGEP